MAKAYVIVHGGVDQWRQGEVIPATAFEDAKFDTQRLLDLGAIREADADEARQMKPAPAATNAAQAEAAAPENTTGSQDVPAIPPAPVDDKGKGK